MSRILLIYFFPLLLLPDVAGAKSLKTKKAKPATRKAAAVSPAANSQNDPYGEFLAAQAQIRLITIASPQR